MIDFARITVRAGGGGRGAGSFTHIKGKRRGKADGGDGGGGGNAYLVATHDLNTLEPYRFVKDYEASRGQNGLSKLRRGATGADLVLKVPVGTLIKVTDVTKEPKAPNEEKKPPAHPAPLKPLLLLDLTEEGQKVLIARGGEGGKGNAKLRDEFGRRPLAGEAGKEGELLNLTLELKLIADVGLIGLPNAGKSTLLAAITAAKPAIADYPFTTLEPNLGVLSLNANRSLVLADIPGLIEGASEGKGLGDLFLRHIERTKMLLHIIDVSGGDSEKIWQDYQTIRTELKAYSKELTKKKEIIVLNKIDLVGEDALKKITDLFKNKRKKVIAVSALKNRGLTDLSKLLSSFK